MFDDNSPRNSAPPQNLPIKDEPSDMFGDLDDTKNQEAPNALEAGRLKKKESSGISDKNTFTPDGEEKNYVLREPILGKIILIVLIGILLAGIVMGGLWFYNNFLANKNKVIVIDETTTTNEQKTVSTTPEPEKTSVTEEVPPSASEENQATSSDAARDMQVDEVLFGEPIDTDRDGLDDVRERELGTDPKVSDTDKDGLIDGDEVIIWKTNPLNPDTDGDGYLDGEEVKNGYSPLGPGKIFNATQENVTNTAK